MKIMLLVVWLPVLVACNGPDSSQPSADTSSTPTSPQSVPKKYLAANVLLAFSQATAVAAALDTPTNVDTTTQVLASNVLLDSVNLGIQASDVQSAFEQVVPDIHQIIIGTWSITDLAASRTSFTTDGGTITFHPDGTYDYTAPSWFDPEALGSSPVFAFAITPVYLLSDVQNVVREYAIIEDVYLVFRISGIRRNVSCLNNPLVNRATCPFDTPVSNGYNFPIYRMTPQKIGFQNAVLKR